MKQGDLVEIEITDLNHNGDGVGRSQGQVIFVPDTVTGDRILARIIHIKRQYAQGKLQQLIHPSPQRIRPRCIVADKCGGCQWQHIDDDYQRTIKQHQVIQTLERTGGFDKPNVAPLLTGNAPLGYRNKATYPLARATTGKVQAGYYRRQSHQIINLNQCPVQDPQLNPLLAEVKQDIEQRGWSIYNEQRHQGKLRHLSLRIGRRTGEIFLTLVTTDRHLEGIEEQANIWLQRYPQLVGVALNYNSDRTNTILGQQTQVIAGKPYLQEIFAGLTYQLSADTFFQVNTEAAEALLEVILEQLDLQGQERVIDAYCGIGTFTLPLAQRVGQAIGIEAYIGSICQARANAKRNNITNVTFLAGTVEKLLPQLQVCPDLILLDPPRKGGTQTVLDALLTLNPPRFIYISCQPPTLARDLKYLCQKGNYQLTLVQPADFFPQTAHVECAAFLDKSKDI